MANEVEQLEPRALLSANHLFDSYPASVLDASAEAPVLMPNAVGGSPVQPLVKRSPPVGGTYRGVTSRAALNGIPLKRASSAVTIYDGISLSLRPGRRGRLYGTLSWAPHLVGTENVPLIGTMSGSSFTVRGSAEEGVGGIVMVTTTIKVTGTASADGRRITGTFRVFQEKLVANEDYTGRFNIKRTRS